MYHTGELIKFSPFVFKNGNQPKPKYCIVLGQINDKVMMANLPTSKDHVPLDVMVYMTRICPLSWAAAWLTFVESCKLQKKAALEVFNGYFQRIAEGRRDYDLITEEVLC